MRSFLLILPILFFASCGYQFQDSLDESLTPTISIPYVIGDDDGNLTSAIIKEISVSGAYIYKSSGGQYILNVRIMDTYDENIGFRYDRHKKGRIKHEIIPVETREYILVEVEMIEAGSGCIVKGPTRLQSSTEFDHEYYFVRDRANTFSLGQLTDYDSAQDAALPRLNKNLAEKIADYVIYGW